MQVGMMIDSYLFVRAQLSGHKPGLKGFHKFGVVYVIYQLCYVLIRKCIIVLISSKIDMKWLGIFLS